MQYLVGTESVHTTASICDYLDGRIDTSDSITVVAVVDDPSARRDRQEALNVAAVRLAAAGSVDTELREPDDADDGVTVASALRDSAAMLEADEIVIGARGWRPVDDNREEPSGLGSTARELLGGATRPVVVVPGAIP
ncbi:universal stress protein [Natrialba swarupiae]|uniref:Universal stress protein n=1 Tax=Natrialba swarupiae TaxID=2448032 RepID=A0A5D5AKU9_9EURY|nr:universal stress protein [Natrialba swarupiae]TYT62508.1 universal stress protein [Natrialba swarupiae]